MLSDGGSVTRGLELGQCADREVIVGGRVGLQYCAIRDSDCWGPSTEENHNVEPTVPAGYAGGYDFDMYGRRTDHEQEKR